jgi:hypothetical protein
MNQGQVQFGNKGCWVQVQMYGDNPFANLYPIVAKFKQIKS